MPQPKPLFHFKKRCGDFGTFTMAHEDEARTSTTDDDVEVLEETDAEEIAAERQQAMCIVKRGRPGTRAAVPHLVGHVPDAAEPGQASDDASDGAESDDDDLRLTQELVRHRILVAANHREVQEALDDCCGPEWRNEPCILRERLDEEPVDDSVVHSADDSGASGEDHTDALLELLRSVTGNLEDFLKVVERRTDEERVIEHRLAELSLAKEREERQIALNRAEIERLTSDLGNATDRQGDVDDVAHLEAASTTCEHTIDDLQREETELLAERERLRRKALNHALSGLLRDATVDAQHRQIVVLVAENAGLREELQCYQLHEDAERFTPRVASADETVITDDGEDHTAEGHGFGNASWSSTAGSRTYGRPVDVVPQNREVVGALLRIFIACLWVALITFTFIFIYFISVSNGN